MAAIYEKLSDTEFQETTEVTDTKVRVHSIDRLLGDRAALSEQIVRQTEELNEAIARASAELAKIDALLVKATELGVKEETVLEPEPIMTEVK